MADTEKTSVTRVVLAEKVAAAHPEMTTKDATKIVDSVLDTIKDALSKGSEVMISGFGKFVVLDKKSRMGRNPQTGQPVEIAARKVLKFRPSDVLKVLINKSID